MVQVFVVPSCVIDTLAVALPLYVISSRRSRTVGVPPVIVVVIFMRRTTLPAVG